MNLLIYFCIPLVVTGRTTRGTYGRENEESGEIGEESERSRVTIVDTIPTNPETSETSESYANFYPGHIDYENPELKEYAVDHQDGTYYRKGVGEQAVLTKPALLGGKNRGQQVVHPSHITTDIYNSLRGKKVGPVLQESPEEGPVHGYGLPASLAGLDPRYAALLAAQYGHGHGYAHAQKLSPLAARPLAYPEAYPQQAYAHSPVGPLAQYAPGLVGGRHHHQQHVGLIGPYSGQSLYQTPLNPYYPSRGAPGFAYAPGALPHQHHHHAEHEQLPVAQQVVPTLHAPLIKSPLYTTPILKTAVPQQVLLKSAAPVVPIYQQPTVLNEAPLLKSSPHVLLNHGGHVPVYQQLFKAPLVHQPVLEATVGAGLPAPLLKTAPGVEATIVPAIEEHLHELGHAPASVLTKAVAPVHPAYYSADGLYLAPNPKILLQKHIIRKPAVFTEKAVLKAALAPAYHHHPAKAVIKAPLHSHYIQGGHGHLEQGLSENILSSQKGLVNALISSDSKKGLRGLGPTHIEVLPSLSYGYSFSMYPDEKGVYGPAEPLGHHEHSHAHHHHQEEVHHHDHHHHH